MENRTLDQAKELVNSSFPTIFSKEDVMNLLGSISIPEPVVVPVLEGKFALTEEQIESLSEKIASQMEDDVDTIIDSDDADFDIDVDYDRRINITIDGGITINTSSVETIAQFVIREFINELNEANEED